MASKFPFKIPKNQLVSIFVQNLNQELGFHLQILSAITFDKITYKGINIEKALISKGVAKIFKETKDNAPQ